MNITEANDLNVLLRYVLNLPYGMDTRGNDLEHDHDEARAAAERLVGKAYKALNAGLTPDKVAAAWPELLLDNGPTVFADDDTVTVVEADAYLRANGIDPDKIRKDFGS